MIKKITWGTFYSWALHQKDANEIVGYREDMRSCPIAQFYKDRGANYVWVSDTVDFDTDDHIKSHKLPKWAMDFILEVDSESPDNHVTAGEVVEILRKIS